jgi:hypothetical protein
MARLAICVRYGATRRYRLAGTLRPVRCSACGTVQTSPPRQIRSPECGCVADPAITTLLLCFDGEQRAVLQ